MYSRMWISQVTCVCVCVYFFQVPPCPKCLDPAELGAPGHSNADRVLGAGGAGGEPGARRRSL